MKRHPWTAHVHATMLAERCALSSREIIERFGRPDGNQTGAERLSVSVTNGLFDVSFGVDGCYLYKALRKTDRRTEWTPEKNAMIAAYWPTEGATCIWRFPGATKSALISRLEVLNESLPIDQKIRRVFAKKTARPVREPVPPAEPRSSKSRDGLPMVNSIFNLARALT